MSFDSDWNDSILDLLGSKKVARACPACQSLNTGFMASTELAIPKEVSPPGKPQSIPVIVVACNDCGHLRFFSSPVLLPLPK